MGCFVYFWTFRSKQAVLRAIISLRYTDHYCELMHIFHDMLFVALIVVSRCIMGVWLVQMG